MSDTMYVLDGDTEHDAPNGGPGAVGTSSRLRARIDDAGDVDFVIHYGDLGYAKGAVFLWDAWMSMMSYVGSRVPYMVSIGNHGESSPALSMLPPMSSPFNRSRTFSPPLLQSTTIGTRARTTRRGCRAACTRTCHASLKKTRSSISSFRCLTPFVPALFPHTAWFDGDVDSLGECGVGTDQRFRAPLNGSKYTLI